MSTIKHWRFSLGLLIFVGVFSFTQKVFAETLFGELYIGDFEFDTRDSPRNGLFYNPGLSSPTLFSYDFINNFYILGPIKPNILQIKRIAGNSCDQIWQGPYYSGSIPGDGIIMISRNPADKTEPISETLYGGVDIGNGVCEFPITWEFASAEGDGITGISILGQGTRDVQYLVLDGSTSNRGYFDYEGNPYQGADMAGGFAFQLCIDSCDQSFTSIPPATCSDGIQNQDETGIDTGGVCYIPGVEKEILSFGFQNLIPAVNGVINEENRTIVLTVPFGADITALAPAIIVSSGASVNPNNNTAQNFSNPIVYTVTAEDNSTQIYTITVIPFCVTDCFSNVLFFPGIMGSRLYEAGLDCGLDIVGPECGDQELWVSLNNPNQANLVLDEKGKSINNIYTKNDTQKLDGDSNEKGIVDEISVLNIYKSFIADLKDWKDDEIIADYAFIPYDWRLSLEDIITNGSVSENNNLSYGAPQDFSESFILQKLEELQASSKSDKVTIIAHSNGGLVVKALVQKLKDTNNFLYDKIDKIIFVAVPQVGTPDAVAALLYGTELGSGFIMDNDQSRQLSENMPTVYNLLPSASYFTTVDPAFAVDKIISFENQPFFIPQTSQYGVYVSNVTELKNYILGTDNRTKPSFSDTVHPNIGNADLYSQAETVHQILDSWRPSPDTKVIQVAGWGEETIAGLDYKIKKGATERLSYKPRLIIDGDGTVVVPSALWMSDSSPDVERWWVDLERYNSPAFNVNRKHRDILEIQNLRDFIKSKITNSAFSDSENIVVNNTSTLISDDTRLHYTLHSPLTLGITDSEGRYTGMDPVTQEIKQEIPGVVYRQIGETQFLSVPAGIAYTLRLQGYEEGNFSLDVDEQQGNEITESISFEGISSSTLTLVTMSIDSSSEISTSKLKIDQDGNGSADQIYQIVNGATQATIIAPSISASVSLNIGGNSSGRPQFIEQPQIKVEEEKTEEIENNKKILKNVIIVAKPAVNNKPIIPAPKKKTAKKVAVVIPKKDLDVFVKNTTETPTNSENLSASVVKVSANTSFWGIIRRFIYNIFH